MKQREIFEFTLPLATTVVTHRRIISQFLRREHSLEYNEFAILLVLKETGYPQQIQSLMKVLYLSKRMLWANLLDMENRGLIKKDASEHDGRVMSVSLSDAGKHRVNRVLADLDDLAQQNFWAGTPVAEITIVSKIGIMKCLANMEGRAIPQALHGSPKAYFTCALLMYIRLLPRRWEAVTQERGKLTLGEYRFLSSLEKLGPMSPQYVAEQLLVQKSSVSSYKEKLLKENLITQETNPADKRSVILALTSKGNELVGYLTDELNDLTRSVYDVLSDNEITACKVLMSRMYHNLRLAQ